MSSAALNPVSYVVLGLLLRDGPSTAYDLKQAVGRGIAHFWPFQHSHLYAETERLAAAGLLEAERERGGRHRRRYRLTAAGRSALARWLAEPTDERPQIRSLGLLKLFFGHFAGREDVGKLAQTQATAHGERLAITAEVEERLLAQRTRRHQLAALRVMRAMDKAAAAEWRRIGGEHREQRSSRRVRASG